MGAMASQITSLTIVNSTVSSGADQRTHLSSSLLAFVWGIHWWLVNSPHKWPVIQKMFPFEYVIMFPCSVFNDDKVMCMTTILCYTDLTLICSVDNFYLHSIWTTTVAHHYSSNCSPSANIIANRDEGPIMSSNNDEDVWQFSQHFKQNYWFSCSNSLLNLNQRDWYFHSWI